MEILFTPFAFAYHSKVLVAISFPIYIYPKYASSAIILWPTKNLASELPSYSAKSVGLKAIILLKLREIKIMNLLHLLLNLCHLIRPLHVSEYMLNSM